MSRKVEALALAAAFTGITVWWLWPLPTVWATHSAHFAGKHPPSLADFYLIVWVLAWDAHALVTQPLRLFDANSFSPTPLSLAYSEHLLGYLPLFAPTYWLTGNPILATNLLVFLTYPLCALAMYALARRFVGGPAAALAGFLFAFAPWRYRTVPHLHMLGVFYLPLALLLTERWLERARTRDAVLLFFALLLQALSSAYLAYALFLAYAPYLALALWRWRRRLDGRRCAGLAAAGGASLGVLAASMLPYLVLRSRGLIPSFGVEGAGKLGLQPTVAALAVRRFLTTGTVGAVGYVLALVALLPPWRSGRRWPLAIGVTLALVGTVAAHGEHVLVFHRLLWSPYALLADWVPGFSTIRLPARFIIVAHAGLALLAGLGAARLLDFAPRPVAWPAVTAAATLAVATFSALPALPLKREPVEEQVPAAYRWLAAHGRGHPLLEMPRGRNFDGQARRLFLSTYHWLPIFEGYGAYTPRTASYIYWTAQALPSQGALQELVDHVDVGWILVHRDELPPAVAARWQSPLPPGLEPVAAWGDDLLLRVRQKPLHDRRARFVSTTETLGGVPIAPLGPACPGRISLLAAPPMPWGAGRAQQLQIEIRNEGEQPWPAFGFYPRHLVQVRASFTSGSGAHDARSAGHPIIRRFPLRADPAPGEPLAVPLRLLAPRRPGPYVLRIELVQTMAGPLARCGTAPLEIPVQVKRPVDSARSDVSS